MSSEALFPHDESPEGADPRAFFAAGAAGLRKTPNKNALAKNPAAATIAKMTPCLTDTGKAFGAGCSPGRTETPDGAAGENFSSIFFNAS